MGETHVTRGGQITLPKDIRRTLEIEVGDKLIVNREGNNVIISKKDPAAFDQGGFLPDNFEELIKKVRSRSMTNRLKRLGVLE